jgi:hypothetical protein
MTNRRGEVVTTAVTNLDLHDISRSARTYGASGYFVVTPLEVQHQVVGRILSHWQTPQSQEFHPDRFEALSLVRLAKDFEEVKASIKALHGEGPEVMMPDARPLAGSISYAEAREQLLAPGRTRPAVIVLGTGWGIAEAFYPTVDRILAPVHGLEIKKDSKAYNHLSVRAAAAIIFDRLFGAR